MPVVPGAAADDRVSAPAQSAPDAGAGRRDAVGALQLFAEAIAAGSGHAPRLVIALQTTHATHAKRATLATHMTPRWRGAPACTDALVLGEGAAHRASRLQVLRHVLDRVPGGRWTIAVGPDDDAGLLGPCGARHDAVDGAAPEHARVAGLAECLHSWPHPVLLRRLFLSVDGRRVDALLADRFPGAARDVALDPAPALPAPLEAMLRELPAPRDARSALRVALALHRRLLAMHARGSRTTASPAWVPVVPAGDGPPPSPSAGSGDGHDAGAEPVGEDVAAGGAARAGQGGASDATHPPTRAHAPTSQASQPLPDDGRAREAAPPEADAVPDVDSASGPRAGRSVFAEGGAVTRHDEWNYLLRAYHRRWTSVRERRLDGQDPQYLAALRARYPGLARQIRRQFARLRADERRRERRLPDGELVDLDAAIDSVIDRRRSGAPGDDRHYASRPRRRRDVCVAMLLDMSGSTGYPIVRRAAAGRASVATGADEPAFLWQPQAEREPDPFEPTRKVIDVARDAVGLLGEALQALGDRHAIFAFSGDGRDAVDFAIVRDFDDGRSAAWGSALAAVEPQGSTRTGAAVRHALHRLRAQPARRRILIVLSDGYPQDSDYGPDRDDREYGLQDTAHALREAKRAGIATFNLSIDAGETDYLRRMCPPKRYWVVDDVEALPARMLALYRLLAVAS